MNQKLPTVFFYHGWQSHKERVLEEAYFLAEENFRVLIPDAYSHGERKNKENQNPLTFWKVVKYTIDEFSSIANFYVKEGKTMPDKIGVAGLSMGGIITSGILTQYNWVKAAIILMGSPSPIEFTEWLLENNSKDIKLNEDTIERQLKELSEISLNSHPSKIDKRFVYFWHGLDDNIVPAEITRTFVEKNKMKDHGKNIDIKLSEGVGHKVPAEIIQEMPKYFKENL